MNSGYRFIDCHSHLLPGVDDGSKSMKQTTEAFSRLAEQGCIGCVLTPHMCAANSSPDYWWFADRCKIEKAYESLAVEQAPFPLRLGAEVNVQDAASAIDGLKRKQILSLAGSKVVLTEFDPDASFARILSDALAIRRAGFSPVLAHPERLFAFQLRPENLKRLSDVGVMVQINAYSIVRDRKEAVREVARHALSLQLVRYIGSDSHPPRRWPIFEEALQYIHETCSEAYADAICFGNARKDFWDSGV